MRPTILETVLKLKHEYLRQHVGLPRFVLIPESLKSVLTDEANICGSKIATNRPVPDMIAGMPIIWLCHGISIYVVNGTVGDFE